MSHRIIVAVMLVLVASILSDAQPGTWPIEQSTNLRRRWTGDEVQLKINRKSDKLFQAIYADDESNH
uniref:Uncharacterized protein n=1 Tax=Ciona intestinalis TaxID=7719 RepID=F7AN91_CIOIN